MNVREDAFLGRFEEDADVVRILVDEDELYAVHGQQSSTCTLESDS
jgi:hypothetical protein